MLIPNASSIPMAIPMNMSRWSRVRLGGMVIELAFFRTNGILPRYYLVPTVSVETRAGRSASFRTAQLRVK